MLLIGVDEDQIMDDATRIARSELPHDFVKDGPHIVTGPVHVQGARAGDVLRVDVVGLVPRAPYGVISNRHGKGALPGEYPLGGSGLHSVFATLEIAKPINTEVRTQGDRNARAFVTVTAQF